MNSISSKARPSPTIPPAVSKQLVATARARSTAKATTKRVPPEAAEAISEALRLFISEAHRRASIEVSCVCVCDCFEGNRKTQQQKFDLTDATLFISTAFLLCLLFRFAGGMRRRRGIPKHERNEIQQPYSHRCPTRHKDRGRPSHGLFVSTDVMIKTNNCGIGYRHTKVHIDAVHCNFTLSKISWSVATRRMSLIHVLSLESAIAPTPCCPFFGYYGNTATDLAIP